MIETDRETTELLRALDQARAEIDRLRAEVAYWRERAEGVRPERDGTAGDAGGPAIAGGLRVPGLAILDKLRDGAMGTVYRARQESLGRVVALKVLREALAADREYAARLRREGRLAGGLSHPNIVATIDSGEAGGRPYIVSEFVRGRTVQDELDRGRVFGEAEAIRVALAVAEALGHLRERGVVHRDIKPANVLLADDGAVKLFDFGLARPVADESWAMAEAGMAVGTPEYISPEQMRGQVDVDIRSDLYALGATLYHMVTGLVPFRGETAGEVMRKAVDPKALPAPADAVNSGLTGGLGAVVAKMMARNREDRYRTPDDLVLDLRCLLAGGRPLLAEPDAAAIAALNSGEAAERPKEPAAVEPGPTPPPPPTVVEERVPAALIVAPAILLLVLLVVAVWLVLGR
jgi:serine/threonine-protein kinase